MQFKKTRTHKLRKKKIELCFSYIKNIISQAKKYIYSGIIFNNYL